MSHGVLLGHWVHAHESDTADGRAYVDASVPLPPSRGRQHLTFRADGTFLEGMPGPDDRPMQASGTFKFQDARLIVQRADGSPPVTYQAVLGGGGGVGLRLKRL